VEHRSTPPDARTPKTKLVGTVVIAALVIAIILLATGAVKFGPF
jgi:hypothetical protein